MNELINERMNLLMDQWMVSKNCLDMDFRLFALPKDYTYGRVSCTPRTNLEMSGMGACSMTYSTACCQIFWKKQKQKIEN